MGYKATDTCLAKAAPDEPIFVLRAQDALAPMVVRYWATLARERGVGTAKLDEAEALAQLMEQWPTRKNPD